NQREDNPQMCYKRSEGLRSFSFGFCSQDLLDYGASCCRFGCRLGNEGMDQSLGLLICQPLQKC
ncbi:MAG TPA: hypothetical protein PLU15_06325, partial [Bacillota bacterium]|nr:hypothetical protein [Bacillota bacterium]